MILNDGQPEAWRGHTTDDASPTLYAERPSAILRSIKMRKYDLMFPLDFAGTLCARDGIKTGPHSPNGEDAYDRKLVVMKVTKRKTPIFFENHKTDGRVKAIDVAMTMGAERNSNASNDNPLVVQVRRRIRRTTFNRPRNEVFVEDDVAQCLGASHNMSPLNNRIVCIESIRRRIKKGLSQSETYGIDQQGGKGGANYTRDISPTICSDSHGTPHALAQIKKRISLICFSGPQDHCISRGYMDECSPTLNAAAGMSGNNRPFFVRRKQKKVIPINSMVIGKLGDKGDRQTFRIGEVDEPIPTLSTAHQKATAVLDRCGNNWKNGKGGCGPLMHEEYAPTLATMFQLFIIRKGERNAAN